jgi:hypothetical protein
MAVLPGVLECSTLVTAIHETSGLAEGRWLGWAEGKIEIRQGEPKLPVLFSSFAPQGRVVNPDPANAIKIDMYHMITWF